MGLISAATTIFDNGAMASGFGGSMTFIKKLTASASATLSFVDGTDGVVLDDTYKEYVFTFKDIHPSNDARDFQFNISIDAGSNYNVTKTTTVFRAYHNENNSVVVLGYAAGEDLAQGTGFQNLSDAIDGADDASCSGYLHLFNPSSTTFVKHFIANTQFLAHSGTSDYSMTHFTAGYGNTTSAVDAIRFQMNSNNIDAGDICLYGIA
jgi:hypothetical protein